MDGDIVHAGLRGLYKGAYVKICKGEVSDEECVHLLLKNLRKDIKQKGILAVRIAQKMGDILSSVVNSPCGFNSIEWPKLSREIDSIPQCFDGIPEIKELVLRAAKSVVSELKYGQELNIVNPSTKILEQYFKEVYEASFEGRIPLIDNHWYGAGQEEIHKRIESLRPLIHSGIKKFAADAIKADSVDSLSLPRRPRLTKVDMEEDLMTLSA
jgi:hypothetical protein